MVERRRFLWGGLRKSLTGVSTPTPLFLPCEHLHEFLNNIPILTPPATIYYQRGQKLNTKQGQRSKQKQRRAVWCFMQWHFHSHQSHPNHQSWTSTHSGDRSPEMPSGCKLQRGPSSSGHQHVELETYREASTRARVTCKAQQRSAGHISVNGPHVLRVKDKCICNIYQLYVTQVS